MSPTIEKVKPAARRSRLEIVGAALAKDEQELEAARAKFVELAAAEDRAVREAKHAEPEKNPYALRSPAQLIRDEREKLDRTIAGLEKGILALQAERDAASSEQAARELVARTKAAKQLAERERELRREAGEAFAALVNRWNALADLLTERSALVAEVVGADLLKRVGFFDREARVRWEEEAPFVVEPVPTTLAAFLDELLEASTGERVDIEAERAEIDAQNARRRETAAKDPGGGTDLPPLAYPLLRPNPLDELVPDLRGKVRSADVSGAPIRRFAGAEIGWPDQAA